MNIMRILIYGLLFITTLYFLNSKKACSCTSLYKGFLFGYLFYYTLIPLGILIYQNDFKNEAILYSRINNYFFNPDVFNVIMFALFYLLGLFCFIIGYRRAFRRRIAYFNRVQFEISEGSIAGYFQDSKKYIRRIAYLVFILSFAAFAFYIYGTGGLSRALALVEINRSHSDSIINYGVGKIYTYVLLLAALLPTSSLIFLSIKKKRIVDSIFLFISVIASILYLMVNGGRSPMLLYIVILLYYYLLKTKIKHKWTVIIILSFISMPVLSILDELFKDINSINNIGQIFKTEWQDFKPYIKQFSFPCMSVLNLHGILDVSGYQFFANLITDVLSLLPFVSFGMSYRQVSYFYKGANWVIQGGIPTDIITYGYLQLNFVGIIVIFLVLGYLFGKLDAILEKITDQNTKYVLGAVLATSCFNIATSADLYVNLQRNMNLIIVAVLLVVMKNKFLRRSLN